LDSCRNFISKPGILRLIDQMAALKLNRLHWHLTDDQGWRLEIVRHPKLTEIGAWRMRDGVSEGGYYSQTEVREIVAYAAARGISIMPEIELPGHATAAIAAYPELGCGQEPLQVGTAWGIYPNNYNAGDERVFEFLEEVLEEVIGLFPFPYIHLGADECLKDEWKTSADCQRRIAEEALGDEHGLQTYFINRVAAIMRKHGRKAVGWDEVLEGEIASDVVVECWRDESVINLALERGHDVIASPRRYCYFDIAVSQVDLADVYAFDPSCGLPPAANGAAVIGGEATLWTEYITEEEMDHMLFPRLLAMSEALWAGPAGKEPLPKFVRRARKVMERLQAKGVKPGPMLRGDGPAESMKGRKDLHVPPAGLEQIGLGAEAPE
jgi:hexosaminidase